MKKIIRVGLYSLLIIFVIFCFFFALTSSIIGHDVKNVCRQAQTKYDGDCVEALSLFLDDDGNSFADRNSSIWALGQLGDSRALPVLEKYYTEVPDGRESLSEQISQYELSKAIELANEGFNATAIFWR